MVLQQPRERKLCHVVLQQLDILGDKYERLERDFDEWERLARAAEGVYVRYLLARRATLGNLGNKQVEDFLGEVGDVDEDKYFRRWDDVLKTKMAYISEEFGLLSQDIPIIVNISLSAITCLNDENVEARQIATIALTVT